MNNHQEDERFAEKLEAAIYHSAGPKSMNRDRPYTGQPWTSHGARGSQLVVGLTQRDLYDCMIRGYIMSHRTYKEDTMEELEPNATLSREAKKGPFAQLNANDMYELVGDADPQAVIQNTMCEIEKLMGIFPSTGFSKCKEPMPVIPAGADSYICENGMTIQRENNVMLADGTVANGIWVARANKVQVDCDLSLDVLLKRHNAERIT